MADACATCGHERDVHQGANATEWCRRPGCTCTKFERANPTVEQITCLCGHPEHPDHDTEEPARICRACQREDRHPAGCWGLFPQGSVAVEVDEHGQPVGDDLHQAIQAATTALCDQHPAIGLSDPWAQVARIAVEAAMPVLLQATRDRLADLEVHATELRCLIEDAVGYVEAEAGWGDTTAARMRAALQVDGPARGHAILHEVERLRVLRRALHAKVIDYHEALRNRVHGGIAADRLLQAVIDLADAFGDPALDQAAQREDDDG